MAIEGSPLLLGRVEDVVVHFFAEAFASDRRVAPQLDGIDDVPRDARQILGLVTVGRIRLTGVDLVGDAVEPAGELAREGVIAVGVGPWDAALDRKSVV